MIEIEYIEIIDSGDNTVGIAEGRYSINGPFVFSDQQCLTDFKKELLELFESHGHMSGRGMVVDNRDICLMRGGLEEEDNSDKTPMQIRSLSQNEIQAVDSKYNPLFRSRFNGTEWENY